MSTNATLLSATGVNVTFGGLKALSNVSIEVAPKEVVGLIGPNGAGKTTLFNAITGIVVPDSGTFSFEGKVQNWPQTHQLANLGIARTLQGVGLFPDLTVLENVMIGAQKFSKKGLLAASLGIDGDDESALADRALHSLEKVYAAGLAHRRAGTLSYPDTKRVSIARAIVSEPKVLMLDEPAGGLGPQDIEWMNNFIRNIHAQMSVLIVEHHMDVVMSVCDRLYVLNFGEVIASGQSEDVRRNPAVVEAYLGAEKK